MASRFSISAIFRGIDRMTRPAREMSKNVARAMKQAESAVGGLNRQLGSMDAKLRTLGKSLAIAGAAGGAALIAFGKAGAEFEHTLASINAVGKPTEEQLGRLSRRAREIGAAYGYSADTMAKGMEAMIKQGFDVQEAIDGIGVVAASAAADGGDFDAVMKGLMSTLASTGTARSELKKLGDIGAKVGDQTAAGIQSLNESMVIFGPTVRQFKISLEDAYSQIGILQDAGLDPSSTGTGLKAIYSKLAAPFGRTAKAIKKLGLEVADSYGNMKPPQQLLNEILAATGKIGGNAEKAAAITELVGLESQNSLNNLIASIESGKYQKVLQSVSSGVDGYADSIARLKQDSFVGDLNKLTAAAEGFQIELFGLVSGPLRDVTQRVNAWAQANQKLIVSEVQKFLADTAAALPTIVTWMERIGKLVAVFYAFRLGIMALTGALKVLNFVAMLNPWTALVYGLVAAVALIWAFWPEISAFFAQLGTTISTFAGKVGDWFSGVWDSVLSFGRGVIDAVSGFFSGIWGAIKGPLLAVGEFLLGLLTLYIQPYVWAFKGIAKAAGWVAGKIIEAWRPVGEFLGRLWDDIVYAATDAVAAISNVVSQIGGWIAEAWATVADVAASVWTSITEAATLAYNAIKSAFEPIRSFFSELWNGVASAFRSALGGVLEKVTWMIDNAGKLVDLVRSVGRDAAEGDITVGDGKGPSTTNPNAATVRELRENKTSAEVTIKSDKPAAITKKPSAPGLGLRLSPSGAV